MNKPAKVVSGFFFTQHCAEGGEKCMGVRKEERETIIVFNEADN